MGGAGSHQIRYSAKAQEYEMMQVLLILAQVRAGLASGRITGA